MVVLPLRYQPSDPVENSLTSATSFCSPMMTVTGFALPRFWAYRGTIAQPVPLD